MLDTRKTVTYPLTDASIASGVQQNEQGAYYVSKKRLKTQDSIGLLSKYSVYKSGNNYYAVYPGKIIDPSGEVKDTVLGRGQYGAAKL